MYKQTLWREVKNLVTIQGRLEGTARTVENLSQISGKLESLVDGALQGQITNPQVMHTDPLPSHESPAPGTSQLDLDGTPEKYAG